MVADTQLPPLPNSSVKAGEDATKAVESQPAAISVEACKALLSTFEPLMNLPDEVFKTLVTTRVEKTFTAGQVMVECGKKRPREMFFCVDGSVGVIDNEGVELAVLEAKSCPYFGELGLFKDIPASSAQLVAKTNCTVLVLSRQSLDAAIGNYPGPKDALKEYTQVCKVEKRRPGDVDLVMFGGEFVEAIARQMIGKLTLFADAGNKFMGRLASRISCTSYPAKTQIFNSKSPSDSICFVVKGSAKMIGPTGAAYAELVAGHSIGEVGVLLNLNKTNKVGPVSSVIGGESVVSGDAGECLLFTLSADDLKNVGEGMPQTWNNLKEVAESRYSMVRSSSKMSTDDLPEFAMSRPENSAVESVTAQLTSMTCADVDVAQQTLLKMSLFQNTDPDFVSKLALMMHRDMWKKGETIVSLGNDPDCMFFLAAGSVNIISEFGDVVDQMTAHLGPDSFFGEVALIENVKRTATITCSSQTCSTYALKKADFDALLREHPQVAKTIHETSKERMQKFLMRNILA